MDGRGIDAPFRWSPAKRMALLAIVGLVATGLTAAFLAKGDVPSGHPTLAALLGILLAASIVATALALLLRLFPLAVSLAAAAFLGVLGTVGAETTDFLVPDPLADLGHRPSLVDLAWLVGMLVLLVLVPALAGGLAWFYLRDGIKLRHHHRRAAHQMLLVTIAIVALLGTLLVTKPAARPPAGTIPTVSGMVQ